jgi:hypothetical protein
MIGVIRALNDEVDSNRAASIGSTMMDGKAGES